MVVVVVEEDGWQAGKRALGVGGGLGALYTSMLFYPLNTQSVCLSVCLNLSEGVREGTARARARLKRRPAALPEKGKKHSKCSMCVCVRECHVTLLLHGTLDVVPFFLFLHCTTVMTGECCLRRRRRRRRGSKEGRWWW